MKMSSAQSMDLTDDRLWQRRSNQSRTVSQGVKILFGLAASVSILTNLGIVATLIFETIEFFKEVPFLRFITDTQWTPLFTNPQYGIIVLITATVMISSIALLVAVPLGLLAAICLGEYAPAHMRGWLKPVLELLAGVPTVVYGYFALTFVTPLLQKVFPQIGAFNALSAGLVLGIAILPIIASLSEDAIFAVPESLRQGSYALGATRRETVIGVVLPAALSGIVAACILAMSRAVGETMIVTIAAGINPRLTLDPRLSVATMTAFMAQVSLGDAPIGSIEFKTLFAVGTTLFLMTLMLNILSFWIVRRFREKYE